MFIHLAGDPGATSRNETVIDEGHPNTLLSFAHADTERTNWGPIWRGLLGKGLAPRIMIDSGAFTAFTLGKTFEPGDYAEWAQTFAERWNGKLADLSYMNLDVIGDQAASWRNQRALEKLGMRPIPIITYDAQMKDLRRALGEYEYIAFGGLVPHAKHRTKLRGWLDTCFREVMKVADKQGSVPRVHLLGVTTEWALMRYPVYSTDSSSFLASLRYGLAPSSGLPFIPRGNTGAGDAANAASQYALRMSIRKFVDMQQRATSLWTRRGITWPKPSTQAS